jgi:DNA end-binding protein Ku
MASGSARSIGSGTISFGLVSVPFKLYVAAKPEDIGFNLLHDKCKGRVKQQYVCPTCGGEVIERAHMCKGYEVTKDSFVSFTDEELKKLQPGKTDSLEVVEFVPVDSVDPAQIEKSYYIGPDKGGEKAYQLLSLAMRETECAAVGKFWTHGRTQLVVLRAYQGGIIMQFLFFRSEVRPFDGIAPAKDAGFKPAEVDLAKKLVKQLSSKAFKPEKYRDEQLDRVREAIDQKAAGRELSLPDMPPAPAITDLFEALKRSIRT